MTQYELLTAAESLCRILCEKKIKPEDVQYLKLYADYIRLKDEGHKISFITYWLGEQYGCSERTVLRVVRRMGRKL